MMLSKEELKKEYLKTFPNESEKQVNYFVNSVDVAIRIGDKIIVCDKPSIETSFCFGYGYNGISDSEDYADAERTRESAINSEEYFLKENIEKFEASHPLKNWDSSHKLCYSTRYWKGGNFCTVTNRVVDEDLFGCIYPNHDFNAEKDNRFNAETFALYTEAVAEARKKFKKRLRTYLKRYGTSKLNTWTYLRD